MRTEINRRSDILGTVFVRVCACMCATSCDVSVWPIESFARGSARTLASWLEASLLVWCLMLVCSVNSRKSIQWGL